MEKFLYEKENCYKVNLPSENEIDKYLKDYADLSLFNSISPIIDLYSIDSEKYGHYKLHEYVHQYNLDKSLLYFYESLKDILIRKLSVKQQILLSISQNIKNECLLLSLEALSERTRLYLIFLSYFLINPQRKNTIILFEFSTLDKIYDNIKVKKIVPTWLETDI
jgi:hypothetical protein